MIPAFETALPMLGLVGVLAYILGAVPFGLVMGWVFGLGDIRTIGSGNIGATNVLRTGNKAAAGLTLVLDAAKGGVGVLVARVALGEDAAQIAGLAAFLGHCFSVFLRFQGGKGVATFFGILIALSWPVGAVACGLWVIAAAIGRMSSLAALVAAALTPLAMLGLGQPDMVGFGIFLGGVIFTRHRPNIARILAGTEPRIGDNT
jgi:glycerol-3-phosphate acyltransferase PlsY